MKSFTFLMSLAAGSMALAANLNTPKNLNAVVSSQGIQLSWSDKADSRIGFEISRLQLGVMSSDSFKVQDDGTNTYIDASADPSASYIYTIKAYSNDSFSPSSDPAIPSAGAGGYQQAQVQPDAEVDQQPAPQPKPGKAPKIPAGPLKMTLDQAPDSPAPMFQSNKPIIGMKVIAPLSDLMNKDRSIPEGQPQPSVTGSLVFPDGSQFKNVTFSLRGNSSKRMDQCSFAKLSVKVPGDTTGTILNGLSKFKIGTHCGESEVPADGWDRMANQKEPIHESLIYRILNIAGAVTFRSRTAVITYQDTSSNTDSQFFPEGKNLTRNAFLFEDETSAAARYNAKIDLKSGTPAYGVSQPRTDLVTSALGLLGESLTQNYDYFILSDGQGMMWNINVLADNTGTKMLQVYDWDISPFAKGMDDGAGSPQDKAMQTLRSLPGMTSAAVESAKAIYIAHKSEIYKAVDDQFSGPFASDTAGKQHINSMLDSFYSWLDDVSL